MALPILDTATYELTLPSSDVKVKYRPFLVKEEKILLMAMEADNAKEITKALKEIVHACTFGSINVTALPTFDLEYIFLQLRAKSVGEVAKLKLKCPDDNETKVDIEVDLTKVQVVMTENHDARIQLTDDIGVVMMYPSIDPLGQVSAANAKGKDKQDADRLFEMIADSLYQIWQGEDTFDAMDYKMKEKLTFLESLNHDQFGKIQQFFETMPTLKHDVEITNPNTDVKSTITLSGMNDFF